MRKLVTEREVIDAWRKRQKEMLVPPEAIVTPAAADAARIRGIRIEPIDPSTIEASPSTRGDKRPKVVFGADHGGFELKEQLKNYLLERDVDFEDVGTHSTESVDYPDLAHAVASRVSEQPNLRGVIIDGAGVGSAMTANKVPGVRAATCHDVYTARNSRAHNNANVLTLGSRVIGLDVAKQILQVWLETDFEGGRHQARVDKIMAVEREYRT